MHSCISQSLLPCLNKSQTCRTSKRKHVIYTNKPLLLHLILFFSFVFPSELCPMLVKHVDLRLCMTERLNKHIPVIILTANSSVFCQFQEGSNCHRRKHIFLVLFIQLLLAYWYDSYSCNYKSLIDKKVKPVPGVISTKWALKFILVPSLKSFPHDLTKVFYLSHG